METFLYVKLIRFGMVAIAALTLLKHIMKKQIIKIHIK